MVGQHIRGIPSRCTSQKGGLHATEDKGAVGNTGGGDPPPTAKKQQLMVQGSLKLFTWQGRGMRDDGSK